MIDIDETTVKDKGDQEIMVVEATKKKKKSAMKAKSYTCN